MRNGNLFSVNASDFDTIQSAIDAAQDLAATNSDLSSSGVGVELPSGGDFSNEIPVIRGNVSLFTKGGFSATIGGLYILPSAVDQGPKNMLVSGIWTPGTIYIKNQTANDSGIFYPDMGKWDILLEGCTYTSMIAENICNVELRQCNGFGDQSFSNCPSVAMYNSIMSEGTTTFSGDSQLANQCSNLDNEEYALNTYNSFFENLNIVTADGSAFPAVHRPNMSNKIVEQRTIVNANDPGMPGEIAADSNYVYLCIAVNTWVKAAHSTW